MTEINNILRESLNKIASFFKDQRFIIFILTFFIYTLSINGLISANDESQYLLTKTMAENYSFAITKYVKPEKFTIDMRYHNGNYYSSKPPGISFLGVLAYYLGTAAAIFLGIRGPFLHEYVPYLLPGRILVVVAVNAILGSLTVIIIYQTCMFLGIKKWNSMLAALIFGVGTNNWAYARTFFRHASAAFFVSLTFYLILRSVAEEDTGTRRKSLLIAGIAQGYAILTEYITLLLLIPICWFLIKKNIKGKEFFLFLSPIFAGLAILAAYNYACFDNPFTLSYLAGTQHAYSGTPQLDRTLSNLFIFLVSPWSTGGLFYLSPILFFFIPGSYIMRRRKYGEEVSLLLSSFFIFVLTWSIFITDLGRCWGPREILPVLPLLSIPLAFALEEYNYKRLFWCLFIPLLVFSVYTSALGGLSRWPSPNENLIAVSTGDLLKERYFIFGIVDRYFRTPLSPLTDPYLILISLILLFAQPVKALGSDGKMKESRKAKHNVSEL